MAARVRIHIDLETPTELARLRLPESLDRRLQSLLDKQDQGHALTSDEGAEADGLVELARRPVRFADGARLLRASDAPSPSRRA